MLLWLQDAVADKEAQLKDARDSAAAQAEQLSQRCSQAARLEEEVAALRADADAQRESGRRKVGAAEEALEEHAARLHAAEAEAASRGHDLAAARSDIAALQDDNSHLQAKVSCRPHCTLARCSLPLPNCTCIPAALAGGIEPHAWRVVDCWHMLCLP